MEIREGFCQCGCGHRANALPNGKGFYRFLAGHNGRKPNENTKSDPAEDEKLVEEFTNLCYSVIQRHFGWKLAHPTNDQIVTKEDLFQEGMIGLLRFKDRLHGVTDRQERGYRAWKIMRSAMAGAFENGRWQRHGDQDVPELVPVLSFRELGYDDGDYDTLDLGGGTEDHASYVDLKVTLETHCPPDVVKSYLARSDGHHFADIGEALGYSGDQGRSGASAAVTTRLSYYARKLAALGLRPGDTISLEPPNPKAARYRP